METINDIEIKYKKETGESSIYQKTKMDTLVYDEKYVHWLQELLVANGAKSKHSALPIQNVMCRADFGKGIELFITYKPVKVVWELKDEFQTAIGKQLIEENVRKWDATLTPLKKFWKFKRV